MKDIIDRLRAEFSYDPETGAIFRGDGSRAFETAAIGGYLQGKWRGKNLKAHRVAWILAKGEVPNVIDHINGVCSDNRLVNLRSVTRGENQKNRSVGKNSKTGQVGISWRGRVGRWRVQVTIDGRRREVGTFNTLDEAVSCRDRAYRLAGYHVNHGRRAHV